MPAPSATDRAPDISVVVPTRNSAHLVTNLLESILEGGSEGVEVILNDDTRSTDDLAGVVHSFQHRGLNVRMIQENHSMAQGRKRGFQEITSPILVNLDSDMTVAPGLLAECKRMLTEEGFDAVVIPEVSIGKGFWSRCKVLEKACHDGDPTVESLRCLWAALYQKVDGHDEELVFSEDKDLDLRVRATGARVGRTALVLGHDEGEITFRVTLRKKMFYAASAKGFADKHPEQFALQSDPRRILHLFRRAMGITKNPFLIGGLVILKASEFAVSGYAYARTNWLPRKASV